MKLTDQTKGVMDLVDEKKLLILTNLYRCNDEMCGLDLVSEIGISKHLLSYHIKQLREAGIIEELKTGRKKHYNICPNKIKDVENLLTVLKIINE